MSKEHLSDDERGPAELPRPPGDPVIAHVVVGEDRIERLRQVIGQKRDTRENGGGAVLALLRVVAAGLERSVSIEQAGAGDNPAPQGLCPRLEPAGVSLQVVREEQDVVACRLLDALVPGDPAGGLVLEDQKLATSQVRVSE